MAQNHDRNLVRILVYYRMYQRFSTIGFLLVGFTPIHLNGKERRFGGSNLMVAAKLGAFQSNTHRIHSVEPFHHCLDWTVLMQAIKLCIKSCLFFRSIR